MVQEFFAVTNTSLYHVKAEGSDGYPIAQKIALKNKSDIPVGECLGGNGMIAICKCLISYIPEGGGITSFERRIEMVNTRYWIANSSPIVALFMNKDEALECFSHSDCVPCDSRWKSKTQEVITKIEKDHPAFYVCYYPNLCLDILKLSS